MSIVVGMAQLLVIPGDVPGNLARVEQMAQEAADQGCDIVVFPECVDIGWADARAREFATSVPGPTSEFLCSLAKRFGVLMAAGLTERDQDRIYNAALLIDRAGTILAHHRKINELDFAREIYSVGTSLGVAETEFGKVALNICADNFSGSLALARAQAAMGAVLLVSPSSWAVPPDHDEADKPYRMWDEPYGRIGRECGVPVVGVSNVGTIDTGPWRGYECIGRSLATTPDGQVALRASYGVDAVELRVTEIQLRAA